MSDEEKLEVYQKFEDVLIIDDSEKQKQKIIQLEITNEVKIKSMQEQLDSVMELLKRKES
jgi:hypothetical protein